MFALLVLLAVQVRLSLLRYSYFDAAQEIAVARPRRTWRKLTALWQTTVRTWEEVVSPERMAPVQPVFLGMGTHRPAAMANTAAWL